MKVKDSFLTRCNGEKDYFLSSLSISCFSGILLLLILQLKVNITFQSRDGTGHSSVLVFNGSSPILSPTSTYSVLTNSLFLSLSLSVS